MMDFFVRETRAVVDGPMAIIRLSIVFFYFCIIIYSVKTLYFTICAGLEHVVVFPMMQLRAAWWFHRTVHVSSVETWMRFQSITMQQFKFKTLQLLKAVTLTIHQ
jgi:hypothetical protein